MKPFILGLVGKKKAGKDSIFESLAESRSENRIKATPFRVSFADAIKQDIAEQLGTSLEKVNFHKDKLRPWIQGHGTDMRAVELDYWINKIRLIVETEQDKIKLLTVITDVRYQNEAEWIKSLGGKLLRVYRKETDNHGDTHSSEIELESIVCDNFIYNDEGKSRLKFLALDAVRQLFPDL